MTEPKQEGDAPLERVCIQEAVCIVRSRKQLEDLVFSLTTAGFDRAAIDLMASEDAVAEKLHTVYLDPALAADVPAVPRRRLALPSDEASVTALVFGTLLSVGTLGAALPVLASGGALAAAAAAALGGGIVSGGLAQIFKTQILDRSDDVSLENELAEGGVVVFVRVHDAQDAGKALAIMRSHGADRIHTHRIEMQKNLSDIPLAEINPDPLLGPEKLG